MLRFQLSFVGLSADVTSCSPARTAPKRGTLPAALFSGHLSSVNQMGRGQGCVCAESGAEVGVEGMISVTVLRTMPEICH